MNQISHLEEEKELDEIKHLKSEITILKDQQTEILEILRKKGDA